MLLEFERKIDLIFLFKFNNWINILENDEKTEHANEGWPNPIPLRFLLRKR